MTKAVTRYSCYKFIAIFNVSMSWRVQTLLARTKIVNMPLVCISQTNENEVKPIQLHVLFHLQSKCIQFEFKICVSMKYITSFACALEQKTFDLCVFLKATPF